MVRRFILSRSDICKSRWHTEDVGPEGTDLQRQTCHHIAVAQRAFRRAFTLRLPPVGRAFTVRRFILSRSDILKGRWPTKDVGPEGTDLQRPAAPVGRAFMVRRFILSRSDVFKRL
jgi:hypothetical protein